MKAVLLVLAGLSALVLLSLIHLCSGARPFSPVVVIDALFHYDAQNYAHVVIVRQRLSRLVVALGVGAMLAIAGYVLQKILRNDLVSPSTLGINTGAAAFSVLGIHFLGLSAASLFWPALSGAIAALAFTFLAADMLGQGERDPISLVLGGVMSSTLFSVATAFVVSLDPDSFENILGWLVGDIGIFDYQSLAPLWPFGLAAILVLCFLTRTLDIMALGGEQAESLGVDIHIAQRLALAGTIILAVIAVTVAGPIGFVGLVVPHMAKLLVGETGIVPILFCLLLGSALLTGADIVARTLFAPQLLMVGTVMALGGGAAFLAIILVAFRRRAA